MKGNTVKKILKPLLAASILSLTIGGVAIAKPNHDQDKPDRHCMKKEMKGNKSMSMHFLHKPFFLHGIELTSDQEDKVFALTHAEVPKIRDRMKTKHQLKQELMILVQTNEFNEPKAKELAEKLADIEKEDALGKARTDHRILNVLNAEQRAQVLKNKEQLKSNPKFEPNHDKAASTAYQNDDKAITI